MSKARVVVVAWMPDGVFEKLARRRPEFEWIDAREQAVLDRTLSSANILYGLPPLARLGEALDLRWIQLISAGVPQELCPFAQERKIVVTNLAGLYGNSIAEHAFALMTVLARRLHLAFRNQAARTWDRGIAAGMSDLHGKTLSLVGLGDIGRAMARLARAYGMRVVGCRRTGRPAPEVDRLYPLSELHAMLAEGDFAAAVAPLITSTQGMLGPAEFAAMKPGVIYINISRGPLAQEGALLDALKRGHVAAAGLDVFSTEPLPAEHPFWTMPQVVFSPHYAGEVINQSDRPAERFARNLAAWMMGRTLEGVVDLAWGY
jgi:phosphoglycerate dehydrogenase-like enzyme